MCVVRFRKKHYFDNALRSEKYMYTLHMILLARSLLEHSFARWTVRVIMSSFRAENRSSKKISPLRRISTNVSQSIFNFFQRLDCTDDIGFPSERAFLVSSSVLLASEQHEPCLDLLRRILTNAWLAVQHKDGPRHTSYFNRATGPGIKWSILYYSLTDIYGTAYLPSWLWWRMKHLSSWLQNIAIVL